MKKPRFLKQYFWDIDFEKFNPKKHPRYTIERLLEYGNEDAVRWMFKNFDKKAIKEALMKSRQLTKRSANFWAIFFGIKDKEKVLCLNKHFRKIYRAIWKY